MLQRELPVSVKMQVLQIWKRRKVGQADKSTHRHFKVNQILQICDALNGEFFQWRRVDAEHSESIDRGGQRMIRDPINRDVL